MQVFYDLHNSVWEGGGCMYTELIRIDTPHHEYVIFAPPPDEMFHDRYLNVFKHNTFAVY